MSKFYMKWDYYSRNSVIFEIEQEEIQFNEYFFSDLLNDILVEDEFPLTPGVYTHTYACNVSGLFRISNS